MLRKDVRAAAKYIRKMSGWSSVIFKRESISIPGNGIACQAFVWRQIETDVLPDPGAVENRGPPKRLSPPPPKPAGGGVNEPDPSPAEPERKKESVEDEIRVCAIWQNGEAVNWCTRVKARVWFDLDLLRHWKEGTLVHRRYSH